MPRIRSVPAAFALSMSLGISGCGTSHLVVRVTDTPDVPPLSHPSSLGEQAGHVLPLPDAPLASDARLLGNEAIEALDRFTDYFDGTLPPGAPGWVGAESIETQTRARTQILGRFGNGGIAVDPLVLIKVERKMGVAGVNTEGCEGGAAQCLVVKLDDALEPQEVRWARLQVIPAGPKGKAARPEPPIYRRLRKLEGNLLHLDGELLPPGTRVLVDLSTRARVTKPALSFVHVTSAHLRGGDVSVDKSAAALDSAMPALTRPEGSRLGLYAWDAFVATLNAETELARASAQKGFDSRPAPELVLHGGDTVDVGLVSELKRFVTLTDRLWIPWFQAIGPQDVRALGRLQPGQCRAGSEIGAPGVREACLDDVVRCEAGAPCDEHFLSERPDPKARFIALHESAEEPRAVRGVSSKNHGFDLGGDAGYYQLTVPVDLGDAADRRAHFLVLDTTEATPGENEGLLSPEQLAWLTDRLAPSPAKRQGGIRAKDLVFVVAHHPLARFAASQQATIVAALEACPNVIAYLATAPTHAAAPHAQTSFTHGFWEIHTAPISLPPQEARLITLKGLGGGIGFLETLTFGQALSGDSPYMQKVKKGLAGRALGACDEGAGCDGGAVKPAPPGATRARLFVRLPGSE